MTRLVGLVQARMGSTRLPGKVMKPLAGVPLVGHIFDRLLATPGVSGVVLSTTRDPRNDPLVEYARGRGIPTDRGPREDDIAERLHRSAGLAEADAILKVNGDCPLIDPAILARMTQAWFADTGLDYVSNKIVWTWPEGLSAEIISRRALAWCDDNLNDASERELVASWICDRPDRFRRRSIEGERDLTAYGWAVDTPDDFDFVAQIFDALHQDGRIFGLEEILDLLEQQKGPGAVTLLPEKGKTPAANKATAKKTPSPAEAQ
jgi:spore coat polysaccharide biosynthesis protein SpsF (cytidylyltransferase family)